MEVEETLETELSTEESQEVESSVSFPDDYLDKQTFNEGVDQILTAMEETEEDIVVGELSSFYTSGDVDTSYSAVVFECNGVHVYFPSSYAEDVSVIDGMLVNYGANYTLGALLDSYSVSNYVNSEITVPTYHSATWYQYLAQYGQPYRVVDRYINSYGSLSSSTRESVDLEFSGGNDWAGYGAVKLFLFFIVILLLIREVRTWLTS